MERRTSSPRSTPPRRRPSRHRAALWPRPRATPWRGHVGDGEHDLWRAAGGLAGRTSDGRHQPLGQLIFTMPREDNQGPELCDTSEHELVPCDYATKLQELDEFQQAAEPYERLGFGLSYTTFEYSDLVCDADG